MARPCPGSIFDAMQPLFFLGYLTQKAGYRLDQGAIKRYTKNMERIIKERNKTYSVMDGFIKGMATIGQIFPDLPDPEPTNWVSAWQGVGDAFAAAGDNMRDAIAEFRDSQGIRESAAHSA
jgi:hypothetical protein